MLVRYRKLAGGDDRTSTVDLRAFETVLGLPENSQEEIIASVVELACRTILIQLIANDESP